MSNKFTVGDEIEILTDPLVSYPKKGIIGEIDGRNIYVWQNEFPGSIGKITPKEYKYSWVTYEDKIVLLKSNKTIMEQVSIMMKKLLDADTQTLVKAGYVNGNLDLTEEGKKALMASLFMANKTELVKLAQEKIDEAKK